MANVLLDLLRTMAMGEVADRTRQAEPVRSLIDAIIPPAAAADASAIPQPELLPADTVLTPEQEQMVMNRIATQAPERPRVSGRTYLPDITMQEPTQPAMVDLVEQQKRQGELDQLIAAENAQNTQNFVRQFGNAAQLPDEAELMKQLDPAKMEAQGITPDQAYKMTQAAGSINLAPEIKRVVDETGDESIYDSFTKRLSDAFGNEEGMLTLAMAFNGLRYKPDVQMGAYINDRLKTIKQTQSANKTAAVLRAKGTPAAIQAADYIEQTGDAKGGLKMAMEADQYVTGSGKEMQEKFGIKGLNPNKPYRYNKITKKIEGVGGGDTIFEGIKPSKGHEFVRDESGKILYERPIPKKLSPERAGTKIQSADLVLDDMNRLTNLIEESPMKTTGLGSMLASIPSTSARDAQALAGTIKANIGFDRLQRMRDESPTGGALGQVAVQELQALQSTLGSLDLGQSTEQVLYNVERLKKQYAKTLLALADTQPNFDEYFPEFNRAAYEKILSKEDGKEPSAKPQITPEQAAAELARRRGK